MNKKYGLIIVITSLLLIVFGIVMIYSSSNIWAEYKFGDSLKYVKHQSLFFLIGLLLMYILSKTNYQIYNRNATKIFTGCLILLVLVIIPGIGSIRNGSRSWFGIGSFGIQPSEFTKIGLIIICSKYLSKSNKFMKKIKEGVLPILLITMLIFGLIMLQPDFGTGMIIVLTIIAMMFIGGVSIKFFIGLGLIGILGIVGLIIIAPYRMARITSYIDPWTDPLGTGFQIIQSLYAIGPGELIYTR